jgi:hypothetical protein
VKVINQSQRTILYGLVFGIWIGLLAIAYYVPTSGLIERLQSFTGLKLIAYSLEIYFGLLLIYCAYYFRRWPTAMLVCVAISIFVLSDGGGGWLKTFFTETELERFNVLFVGFYVLEGVSFLGAIALAFVKLRSSDTVQPPRSR